MIFSTLIMFYIIPEICYNFVMDAKEVLRESDNAALDNSQRITDNEKIISNVTGKSKKITSSRALKGVTALGFIAVILIIAIVFGTGNIMPSMILERLVESTDVQRADEIESMKLVFQQAMTDGELPENTSEILAEHGVIVGYMNNGEFVEGNKNEGGELVLKMNNNIIKAGDFINEVSSNVELYNAFDEATYSRTAYYYDEAAEKVFQKIGTNRNNFTDEDDFDEVMEKLMGSGSDITVNSASPVKDENGNYYTDNGEAVSSKSSAESFVKGVREKNVGASITEAALNMADSLKVADTVAKEQRSSLFFSLLMENISKMKAGEGSDSKINEVMDFLYEEAESEVGNVKNGEMITVTGTAVESPSLYAILTGQKVNTDEVQNYSSDRILKMVENKINDGDSSKAIEDTVASTSTGVRGTIGRLISDGITAASDALVEMVSPTVSSSLVDNSYETIKGIKAGEFLVEGAVNTEKLLAKASGATAGDETSVMEYARLTSDILAMDAEADRMKRSPFDATSKNTFLGSIIYNFAMGMKNSGGTIFAKTSSVIGSTSKAFNSLATGVYADASEDYMATFGDCETYSTIGAVGTAQCSESVTFDVSTLNDTFNDEGFKSFVEKNTTLSNGTRTIKDNSVLARFINYSSERMTPLGVTDGGILDALSSNSGSISFVLSVMGLIENFLGTSDSDKRIANGAAFVNSINNPDWETYKYAQRYISLARATSVLRQYAGDSTAYNNIEFFEGSENPVIAYLNHYYETIGKNK